MNNSKESENLKLTDEKLLEIALESRKFELEFLWERSSFFWVFTSGALVAFGATKDLYPSAALAISGFGFITSLCWALINRGSKYWYESWERKIDTRSEQLKDFFTPERTNQRSFLSGKRFSPSKLLVGVSDYATALWIGVLIYQLIVPIKNYLSGEYWGLIVLALKGMFLALTIGYAAYLLQETHENMSLDRYQGLSKVAYNLILEFLSITILIIVLCSQIKFSLLKTEPLFLILESFAIVLAVIALATSMFGELLTVNKQRTNKTSEVEGRTHEK